MLLNTATRDCNFCYFSVVRVGFALYVFDLYIDVFDGSHGCKGNMLDAGKNCHRSIEENFMMNKFFSFLFVFFGKRRWVLSLGIGGKGARGRGEVI